MKTFTNSKNRFRCGYVLAQAGMVEKAAISRPFPRNKVHEYEVLRTEVEALRSEVEKSGDKRIQKT